MAEAAGLNSAQCGFESHRGYRRQYERHIMEENALIVVDVQNDFAHPDGNLYVTDGELVAERINPFMSGYHHIVYTRDWHPRGTSHFEQWPVHCVGGTWGAEFHEDLLVRPDYPVVYKGMYQDEDGYSGFYVDADGDTRETELHRLLQERNVEEVDIVGIALDVCVKATALDAVALGYKTRVIEAATAAVTPEGADEALQELRNAGVEIV